MQKTFSLLVIVLLFLLSAFSQSSQVKEYKLLDKTFDADINVTAFTALDTLSPGMALVNKVFKPVKGNFTVYRFLATFKGKSFTGKEKDFHDILIVKTNTKNDIIVAYQYTLEWAEEPTIYDLFKSNCKNVVLINNMSIDKFNFTRIHYHGKDDKLFSETGIIKFK